MKVLSRPSLAGRRAEEAFRQAVSKVLEENRRLGLPVAVMHRGKAVLVPVKRALSLARTERSSRAKRQR